MPMTPKQRSLLVGGLVTVLVGVPVIVWTTKEDTTRADLIDAGVTADFVPRRLACSALLELPDGGYRYAEMRPIVAVSKTTDDAGRRDVIWPRNAALKARRYIADEDANCRVIENLTWAQVANFDADPAEAVGSCACWDGDAGSCVGPDGGLPDQAYGHNEIPPGQWSGPGCIEKVCGEIAGHRNWPSACPE